MANATDIAVDWSNRHAIDMARIEAGQVQNVTALLTDLEAKIATILIKGDVGPGKADKLAKIQQAAGEAIGKTYDQIAGAMDTTLEGVAATEAKAGGKLLNAQVGVDVFGPVLTENQWSKVANQTLIFGHSSGAWWKSQDEALRFKFAGQMQEGYALGESVDDMIRRVRGTKKNGYTDGVMQASRREAEALVRSSVQTISNAARLAGFEQQGDIVKGIQWQATLDGRTTNICKALNGLAWRLPDYEPIGHTKTFPGPTAHWNCRSTQVAVLRSWAELSGKPIKALDGATMQEKLQAKLKAKGMAPEQASKAMANAQSSMDGQVAADLDFQGWLAGKPDAFARDFLGPGRFALWKSGKIKIKDLTDQNNRPLTIAQLQAAIDGDGFPVETEGVEYLPPVQPTPKFPVAAPDPEMAGTFKQQYKVETVDPKADKAVIAEFLTQLGQDPTIQPDDFNTLLGTISQAEYLTLEALAIGPNRRVLRDAEGKIVAAVTWRDKHNGSDERIELTHIGSIAPGGGSQAFQLAIQDAINKKKGIYLESLDAKSNAFYEKWGIEKKDFKLQYGYTAYMGDAEQVKAIKAKLDAYLGTAGAAAPDQGAAAAKIAEIIASPKGQTLKAAALGKLQKEQPNLPPVEMLAMAEGIAAEKQAAASKASVLSGAKKKLVAGEQPTDSSHTSRSNSRWRSTGSKRG